MGVVTYALFAYLLTAIISFAVIAAIVLTNRIMNKKESKETDTNIAGGA